MRLEAKDIFAGYGKIEVLHGASIRAAAGEIICIIGPNGSGKSTLLKTVFGLLKPTKGTVSFDGKDITRLEPEQKVRLGIAFIPQGRNVFPSLTVRENLEMGGTILDDEKAVRRAIEEALESYPLLEQENPRQGGKPLGRREADPLPGPGRHGETGPHPHGRAIHRSLAEDDRRSLFEDRGDQRPGRHLRHRRTERERKPSASPIAAMSWIWGRRASRTRERGFSTTRK